MKIDAIVHSSQSIVHSRKEEGHREDKLKSACIDFEAIFIGKMLEGLRSTVNKSGFIDGGAGEEIFQDMLFDEYAKQMAKNGTLGIAEMMYKDILSKTKLYPNKIGLQSKLYRFSFCS